MQVAVGGKSVGKGELRNLVGVCFHCKIRFPSGLFFCSVLLQLVAAPVDKSSCQSNCEGLPNHRGSGDGSRCSKLLRDQLGDSRSGKRDRRPYEPRRAACRAARRAAGREKKRGLLLRRKEFV